jgi:hypothetical protein
MKQDADLLKFISPCCNINIKYTFYNQNRKIIYAYGRNIYIIEKKKRIYIERYLISYSESITEEYLFHQAIRPVLLY